MKSINFLLMALFAMSIMTGCEEKEGEMGPAGIKGEVGPPGENGDKGPKGKNADIKTIEAFSSGWLSNEFVGSGREWTTTIAAPEITQNVLDNGMITVYYFLNGEYIYKLPYKGTYASTTKVTSEARLGEIQINSTVKLNPATAKFRYAIAPLTNND